MTRQHDFRHPKFGIPLAEYRLLAKFANQADSLGVVVYGLEKVEIGSGARLKLCSSVADYEVIVQNGEVMLGRIRSDDVRVKREKVGMCSASLEGEWQRLLMCLRTSEGIGDRQTQHVRY